MLVADNLPDEVQVGRHAVKLLDEMRSGRQPLESYRKIVMPLELFRGQSLAPPPESSAGAVEASVETGGGRDVFDAQPAERQKPPSESED